MSVFGEKIQDYEILEHLGKGGFAHVYRARCHRTGLFVAIKMIDKALMAGAGMIGRVRQEVTIHSRLKHPAILELYTFFEDAHYVYLVLELAHNGELAKHFKLGTKGLSEKAAADIFGQVVRGVLYLHTHNIIHRDLSLNNLLLTKDLLVKIADFGLATQLSAPDERHVTMCGTPNYISPEVASRGLHGLPADVWGLGCMLYTLLVGSPPFHTQHVKTTLNKVINADYKIPAELSYQAQDLLQKLLCKDPKKRITLKGITEHPFVNRTAHATSKQEMSRDSGFLTTLHSTQHSAKNQSERPHSGMLGFSKENMGNFACDETKPTSFNVFSCQMENNAMSTPYSHHMQSATSAGSGRGMELQDLVNKTNSLHQNCNNIPSMTDKMNHMEINHCRPVVDSDESNKENVARNCNVKTDTIGVPPLCADRLPAITHKTRNAILKIEDSGVVVEFIKKKGKEREERVVEVCKISKDGMKINVNSLENGKERTKIPKLDIDTNPDESFSYHKLPQKHWKKYLYASRFVDLVKAKTPKITLYTSLAKCQLMENSTDLDMFFYTGEKISFSASEGLKVIDKSLKTYHSFNADPELKYLSEHFDECSNRIKRIQSALSCIPDECFPLIIGKRPAHAARPAASPGRGALTPALDIGSFHRGAPSSHARSDYL